MATKFGLLIDAKTKGENNIKRLGNSMQGVEGKAKNLGMAVRGVGSAFKALFAAAAVAGFSAFVKGAIDSADAFGKLSTRTGIAADKLQAYANAGKLADVSQSDLETGLRTLARTQAEAADGVATYSEAYAKLGLSVKEADGSLRPSDELLGEIADKFADLPNGPEKAAVAMDIFGRSGAKLITLLNGGSEALERFNYETSENFAQNAELFNDKITELQIQFDGFRAQLADALLPALNSIIEGFATMLSAENDFTGFFQAVEIAIRGVAVSIAATIMGITEIVALIKAAATAVGAVSLGRFGEAGEALSGFFGDAAERFDANKKIMDLLTGQVQAPVNYGGGGGGASQNQFEAIEESTNQASENTKEMSVDLAIYLADLEASVAAAEQLEAEQFAAGAAIAEQLNQQDKLNASVSKTDSLFGSIKNTIAGSMANALEGIIFQTQSLSESLAGLAKSLASMFLQAGAQSLIGGLFPSAKGNVFANNKIVPFAYGGIVNKPTLFPMANGMGLMGEAGPEAIMPLKRGRGGRLGVEASGGTGDITVNVDASGSNVQGDAQQSKALGKAIGAAVQAEIVKQKMPGGLLN